jgi:hypothetical protein
MKAFSELFNSYREKIITLSGEDKKWKNIRDENLFVKDELKLPWGTRIHLKQKKDSENKNYNLQMSRGMSIDPNCNSEEAFYRVNKLLESIIESDTVRINELDHIFLNKEKFNIKEYEPKSFFEIGFRIPRLQKYYKSKGLKEGGCDINEFNVEVGNILGYNCQKVNLITDIDSLNLKDYNLIVCYHVLEHLSNPFKFLKSLYNITENNTLFHFEIPVEPDGPHIDRAHLFPFHQNDLSKMIEASGFKPLTLSNQTHSGGPWIERVTFIKRG